MKVYLVFVDLDDYPENGGGLQGVDKIFKDKAKAVAYAKEKNLFFGNCGDRGEFHYYVEEGWVE